MKSPLASFTRRLSGWSLQGRLILASCCLLPMVMLLAWIALTQSYVSHLESSLESKMQLQAYLLLGNTELHNDAVLLQTPLPEARYDYLGSGLYGALHHADGREIWRSPSCRLFHTDAIASILVVAPNTNPLARPEPLGDLEHLVEQGIYRYRFYVDWNLRGMRFPLVVTVMEVDDFLQADFMLFQKQLSIWLSVVLVLALIAQVLVLRWGIAPLRRIVGEIKRVKRGKQTSLSVDYPREVMPLAESLNTLIESEREQGQRHRNTLGDLAHSLKTPLAVVLGAESQTSDFAEYKRIVHAQAQRMDQIVQYQLGRAVKAKPVIQRQGCHLLPVFERMVPALEKVYRLEEMQANVSVPENLTCAVDERDLMELLGNVLENAFKYGAFQINVRAREQGECVCIEVSDDGPGVSRSRREQILQRGERLDTSVQGQGIGLTVTADIIRSYQGQLAVDQCPELKGARFSVLLPRVL